MQQAVPHEGPSRFPVRGMASPGTGDIPRSSDLLRPTNRRRAPLAANPLGVHLCPAPGAAAGLELLHVSSTWTQSHTIPSEWPAGCFPKRNQAHSTGFHGRRKGVGRVSIFLAWLKKVSGTVAGMARRVVRTTVPDTFLNHARFFNMVGGRRGPSAMACLEARLVARRGTDPDPRKGCARTVRAGDVVF